MLSLAFSLLFTGTLSGDYHEEDMCAEWWGYPLNTCIESSMDSDHEYSWGLYCDADGRVIKKQFEVLECDFDSEYTEEVYCDPEDPHLGWDTTNYDTTTDWWYYWYYGNDTTTWYWPTDMPESTEMSYEWHDCGCDYDPCDTAIHGSGYCDDSWYWEYTYIIDTTCYSFEDSDWAYHYRRRTRRMKEKMRRLVDSDSFHYTSFQTDCNGETYYYEEADCEGEGMTWDEWWEQYYDASTWTTDYDYGDYTTGYGYGGGSDGGGDDSTWTTSWTTDWYNDNYWCESKDECTDTENSCMYYEYTESEDCEGGSDGGEDDGGEDDGGEDDGGNDDTMYNTSEPEDTSEPGGDEGGAQGLITSLPIVLSILGLIVN